MYRIKLSRRCLELRKERAQSETHVLSQIGQSSRICINFGQISAYNLSRSSSNLLYGLIDDLTIKFSFFYTTTGQTATNVDQDRLVLSTSFASDLGRNPVRYPTPHVCFDTAKTSLFSISLIHLLYSPHFNSNLTSF